LTVTVAGCTSPVATTVVVVSGSVVPTNSIVASPSGPICSGTSVTFTATAGGGGTTPTYQWQVNGLNVGAGGTTYTSTTLANGDIVTCILNSSSPCASPTTATSNAITMTVNPTVTPTISIAASPTGSICAGTVVNFTATITNGGTTPTYQWQINGANVGTNSPLYSSALLNNGDIVTCILGSNALCASPVTLTSNAITMTVTPNVTPAVSVVASPSGAICAGTSVLFTATPTNGGTTPTYQWQVNGANVGTGGTTYTTTTLANGDIVTCILTSNATCASPLTATSAGITMIVNPTPPTPTISVSGTTLTSSSATGNQWYLNGVLIAGATNQNYTFTVNGTYTVIVTTGGCASAESAPEVILNVGIDDANNQYALNIYPNPNDGNFNIIFNVNTPANYTLELTNALGQLIYKEELKDFSGSYNKPFSVIDYGKGVYTITLTNDKHDVVKKIIVY
ncbi:MAG TPA: T9SS type A sorting domain-containing protein, partial [Bacteroidia bacterium]|nr:T9SS type A sorting domain-containing protein [Bacteroidia bacterium]